MGNSQPVREGDKNAPLATPLRQPRVPLDYEKS